MRGEKKKENRQKENVLLAWIDAGSSSARTVQFDPAKAEGFPIGMVLSEFFAPQWTKDGTKLFLGIKEQEPEPLLWTEKQIGSADKAKDADRLIFTQQSFAEFPDDWVTNQLFEAPRRVTDANPFLRDYAWGSRVLID